jgi:hypothetical protein
VNLVELEHFADGTVVDAVALVEAGLVPDLNHPVKILGEGAISRKLTVVAGWYSRSAHQKITDAGGTAQNLKGEPFEFPKPKKKFVPREAPKKSKKAEGEAPAEGAGAEAAAKPAAPEQVPPAQ